ncbi:TonB-dependent receptor plug domain-containing protein [Marinobacter similis]|uniref:TonB-dependent receptor plug domain-containing protein n=1 Tax=Marinobacter similis TaxID=1420916 RepID=UPI001F1A2228|nr:TonB-dependent receptor plug domain-containing protein [Marinobacter similis]
MTSSTTTSPKKLFLAASAASCTLFLSLSLPALAWGQTEEPELYPELLTKEGEQSQIPEVLTTTRLRQSKLKVPGTTTIITGDMIRDLGIMNLVEVFRLVPGMVVGEYGSNNQVTSYHGTSQYEQRRLQVQIDGRTAYRASLSDVDWIAMPVALENIERIEVSRGPNAAAYGINAFLGSINIITRSPYDTAGAEAYTSIAPGATCAPLPQSVTALKMAPGAYPMRNANLTGSTGRRMRRKRSFTTASTSTISTLTACWPSTTSIQSTFGPAWSTA